MKTRKSSVLTTSLICGGMVFGLGTSSVLAADFVSTFSFPSNGSPSLDTLRVNWSTTEESGEITQNDLTDWSVELWGGGSLVYTDVIITGGAVQPIGGVTRVLFDDPGNQVRFALADTATPLEGRDWFENPGQSGLFTMFPTDNWNTIPGMSQQYYMSLTELDGEVALEWRRYFQGTVTEQILITQGDGLMFDGTERLGVQTTPEPSSLLGYITLGGLILGSGIKKALK